MIKTDKEYRECKLRLDEDLKFLNQQREALAKENLSGEELERAMEAHLSFHQQLSDEVTWYERVKRRDFDVVVDLIDLGRVLIALRIANGISQRQLAEKLGVDESQISRDEKNEYHGITLERAQRVVDALGEKLVTQVEDRPYSGPRSMSLV
jgi:ribosome-binding protein aMBF1 (putative translation factor)